MKYKKPASLSSFIDTIGVSWRPKPETISYNCRGYIPTKCAHDKVSTVPERRTNIGISRLQTQIPDPRPTYVSILPEGSNYTADGSKRYQRRSSRISRPRPRTTYASSLREGSNYTSDGSRRYQTSSSNGEAIGTTAADGIRRVVSTEKR